MLWLTEEDLGRPSPGGRAGVLVWWVDLPRKKRPCLALAWPDLVLLRPVVEWPPHLHPRRLEGWKEASFRISKLPELPTVVVRRGVQVPDVTPCLERRRASLPLLLPSTGLRRRRSCSRMVLVRYEAGDRVAWVLRESRQRIAGAIGDVEHRLVLDPPMMLCYKDGLRAVASVVLEEDACSSG